MKPNTALSTIFVDLWSFWNKYFKWMQHKALFTTVKHKKLLKVCGFFGIHISAQKFDRCSPLTTLFTTVKR